MKGVLKEELEQEVERVLADLDNKEDVSQDYILGQVCGLNTQMFHHTLTKLGDAQQ